MEGIILLHISHLKRVRLSSVDTFNPWKPGWKDCPLKSPPAGYSGVMRNQRAHYGCGAALGVAVHSGVPELEMLVVKERQRNREIERERWRANGGGSWERWRKSEQTKVKISNLPGRNGRTN